MELESFTMNGRGVLSDASFSLGFGVSTLIFKGDLELDGKISLPTNILISENSSLRMGETFSTENGINVTNLGTFIVDSNFFLSFLYNYNESFFNKAINISRDLVNYGRITVKEELSISSNFKSYKGSFEGEGKLTCYNCLNVELYGVVLINMEIGDVSNKYPTIIYGSATLGKNWTITNSELNGNFNFSKGSAFLLNGVSFKRAILSNDGEAIFYGGSMTDSLFQSNGTIKIFDSLSCDTKSLINANGNISFRNSSSNCNYNIYGAATLINAITQGVACVNGTLLSENSKIEGYTKVSGAIIGNITISPKGRLQAGEATISGSLTSYGTINGNITGDTIYLYNSSIQSSNMSVSEIHFWGEINAKDSFIFLKRARMYNGSIIGPSTHISFDECTVDNFEVSASLYCRNCTININYGLKCTSIDEKIFEGGCIKMTKYSSFNISHSSFIDTYTSGEGNILMSKSMYINNFTLNAVAQFNDTDINCTLLNVKNKVCFTDTRIKSKNHGEVIVSNPQDCSINGTFMLRNIVFRLSGVVTFSPSYIAFENSYIENKNTLHISPASKDAYMNYVIKNYGSAIFEECNFQALYNYGRAKMNKNTTIEELYNELQCVLGSNLTVDTLVQNSTGFISGEDWVIVTKSGFIEGEISGNFFIDNGKVTLSGDTIAIDHFYAHNSMILTNSETMTNLYDMTLSNVTTYTLKRLINKGYLSLKGSKPSFSINNGNRLDLDRSNISSLENVNSLSFFSDTTIGSLTNKGTIALNNFTVRVSNEFSIKKGFSSDGRFFIERDAILYMSDFMYAEVLLEGEMHLLSDCSASKLHLNRGSSIKGEKKLTINTINIDGSVEINADLHVLNFFECDGSVLSQGNTLVSGTNSVSLFLNHSTLRSIDVVNNGKMTFFSTTMNESSFYNHGTAVLCNSTFRNLSNSNEAEFTEGPPTRVLNLISDGKLHGKGACDAQDGTLSGIINVSVTLRGEVTCNNASFLKDIKLEGAHMHGSSSVHAPMTVQESEFASGHMNYHLGEFSIQSLNCNDFTFNFATPTIFRVRDVKMCNLFFHNCVEVSVGNFSSSTIYTNGTTEFKDCLFGHTHILTSGGARFVSCTFDGYAINAGGLEMNRISSLDTPTVTTNGTGRFESSIFISTVVFNGINSAMELFSNSFNKSVVFVGGSTDVASNSFDHSTIHASGATRLASNTFTSTTAYFNESTELVFNNFKNSTVIASGSALFCLDSSDIYTTHETNATENVSNSFSESVVWAVGSVKFVSCLFGKSDVFSDDGTEFLSSTFKNYCNLHLHNNTSANSSLFSESSIHSAGPVKFTSTTFNNSTMNASDGAVFESSSFNKTTVQGNGLVKLSGMFHRSRLYVVGLPEFTDCTFSRSPIVVVGTTKFIHCSFTEYDIYTNSTLAETYLNSLNSISVHTNGPVEFGLCLFYMSEMHATATANLTSNLFEYSSFQANNLAENAGNSFFRSEVHTINTTVLASNTFETTFLYTTGMTNLTSCSFSGSEVHSDNGILELRSTSFTKSSIFNNAYLIIDEHSYFSYISLAQTDEGYLLLENVNMSGVFELDINGTIEGKGLVTNEKNESIRLDNALINGNTPGLLKTRNYLKTSRINFGIYGPRKHTDFFALESENTITFSNISVFFYYSPSAGDKFEIAFYSHFRNNDFVINYFNIDSSAVAHFFYENNLTIQVIGCQNGSPNITDCFLCDEGYFFANGSCIPCPKGYYNNLPGSGICLKCPDGYYSDVVGSVQCKECINGYVTDGIQCTEFEEQSSESGESSFQWGSGSSESDLSSSSPIPESESSSKSFESASSSSLKAFESSSSSKSASESSSSSALMSSSTLINSGSGSSSSSTSYKSDISSGGSVQESESSKSSLSSSTQIVFSSGSSSDYQKKDSSTQKSENSMSSSSLKGSESSESSSDGLFLIDTSSEKKNPTINWFFPLSLLLGLGLFICMMMKRGKKEEKVKIFRLCKEAVDGICETDTQPCMESTVLRFLRRTPGNNVRFILIYQPFFTFSTFSIFLVREVKVPEPQRDNL